jgi:hypothetical protein
MWDILHDALDALVNMQYNLSSRRVAARVAEIHGLAFLQLKRQNVPKADKDEQELGTECDIWLARNKDEMMIKSKKGMRAFNEMKCALDAALSDGLISQKAYDQINIPIQKPPISTHDWNAGAISHPLPPQPEVAIPEPEPEPEPEPVPETKHRDIVVVDTYVPEVAEQISCAGALAEETVEIEPAAIIADQVDSGGGHDQSVTEVAGKTTSVRESGVYSKEEEKGFAFTTCFRCGRVDITQYKDQCLPKDIKGECEVDNGIITIVCGTCREEDSGHNKNDSESFQSEFRELRLSVELFEGSIVQKVANTVLSQEVRFITDEGGVAYRDMNAMMAGLRREDKIMSVDVEKYKSGGRTGLVFGFLAGGLIRPYRGQRGEEDEWGLSGQKSLFIRRV